MNGIQDGKKFKLEKPVPGCLGKMVNIFDLGLVGRNKLIADKPYSEGSSISRCQSDVARTSPAAYHLDGEMHNLPMKTLIDQEMSKDIDYARNPPNLVAKLMGLDALPPQQLDIAAQRINCRAHSRSHSDTTSSYWKEDGYLRSELGPEVGHCLGQRDYTDVYEACQKSRRSNSIRDKSPSKGRYDDTTNEKKMALVRQKFMEAKCLATDERLRQSKQFQDALEVLSANKDSFLKFLQEPNSLFSEHLYNMQSIPPPHETKRITVLKPSKMVDNCNFPMKSNEKCTKKTVMVNGSDKTPPAFSSQPVNWKADEYPTQPTRIVVLKPSPGRPQDLKSMASISSASPRISAGEELFGEFECDASRESREVANSIAQQMRDNLGGQWRDENLISSVYPIGYIGDESSYNISETEYAAGNLSDSEGISPTSRHSWDYINRFDSPLSSSFSRASYSPESSVCREAKKRLSERWSMMSSNGGYQESKHVRRNSSTLGDMLGLSNKERSGGFKEIVMNVEEPRASSSCVSNNLDNVNGTNDSAKDLLRSKSVPLSSTQPGMRLNVDIKDPEERRSEVTHNATNGKISKSLFMGMVSSLFSSRNKKMGKETFSTSQSRKECSSGVSSSSPERFDDEVEYDDNMESKNSSAPLAFSPHKPSALTCSGKQISSEAGLRERRALTSRTRGENQDQPSPVSILEPPFEEHEHTTAETLYKTDRHGEEISAYSLKSNLIDKSPPIGSIARTLSWDDSCIDTASSYPLKTSLSTRCTVEEDGEWLFFMRSLLSAVGLDGDVQSHSVIARWHSAESPLDPSLRDKYIDLNIKDSLQEAKRRQRRSMRSLVFDCVNATLLDISGHGSETGERAATHRALGDRLNNGTTFKMVDEVWGRMKDWVSGDTRRVDGDDSVDINSLFVERVFREELVGKGCDARYKEETDCLVKDLENRLLDDVLHVVVVELEGW